MRLIDAEELGEKIEEEFDGICAYDVSPDEAVNDFQDIVDSCKTIDAAPVVRGHWRKVSELEYQCTNCKNIEILPGRVDKFKYCWVCGAKMESEEKDNESV